MWQRRRRKTPKSTNNRGSEKTNQIKSHLKSAERNPLVSQGRITGKMTLIITNPNLVSRDPEVDQKKGEEDPDPERGENIQGLERGENVQGLERGQMGPDLNKNCPNQRIKGRGQGQ